MKCSIIIDKNKDEEVLIYSRKNSPTVRRIKEFAESADTELKGYDDGEIVKLALPDVFCFIVEDNKIYAICEKKRYRLKQRMYQLTEMLPESFVKVNQSCIVSVEKISRFEATLGASLNVILKNGYKDYVSRRCMKDVKERLSL